MSTRRSSHKKLDHWTIVQKVVFGGITAYTLYKLLKRHHQSHHALPVAAPHSGGAPFPKPRRG
jgi:hypothetical protein